MKKTMILLVVLISIGLKAQKVPKKVDLIVQTIEHDIDEIFGKIGRILIDNGYEMESADKTFYSIITKPKKYKYGFMNSQELYVKLRIMLSANEEAVRIKTKGFLNEDMRIKNVGMKNSLAKEGWNFMHEMVKKFPADKIEYFIESEK